MDPELARVVKAWQQFRNLGVEGQRQKRKMPGKHAVLSFECQGDIGRAFSRGGKEPGIARSGGNPPGQQWLADREWRTGTTSQDTAAVQRAGRTAMAGTRHTDALWGAGSWDALPPCTLGAGQSRVKFGGQADEREAITERRFEISLPEAL